MLTARLRWRQGRIEEATQSLERGFALYRDDPWPMPILVKNAFAIVLDLASKDAAVAARLDAALARPFALALLNEERLLIRLEIASRLDAARYVSIAQEMEPDVPWRGNILRDRARTYSSTGHPLAAVARRELAEFLETEPPPFARAMFRRLDRSRAPTPGRTDGHRFRPRGPSLARAWRHSPAGSYGCASATRESSGSESGAAPDCLSISLSSRRSCGEAARP